MPPFYKLLYNLDDSGHFLVSGPPLRKENNDKQHMGHKENNVANVTV